MFFTDLQQIGGLSRVLIKYKISFIFEVGKKNKIRCESSELLNLIPPHVKLTIFITKILLIVVINT
jgi:hypothetical protein